jgi:amino acid transporter
MVSAIIFSCVFYVLVEIASAAAMPRAALLSAPLPAAAAFAASFHSLWLSRLVLATGLIGLLIALNAIFYSATRVIFALGEAGVLPAVFGKLSRGRGAPQAAGLCVGMLSAAASLFGSNAIGPLVDAGAIMVSAIYVMVCVGCCRLRYLSLSARTSRWVRLRQLASPSIATILAVFMLVAGIATPIRPHERGCPAELVLVIIVTLLGTALLLRNRRGGGLQRNKA